MGVVGLDKGEEGLKRLIVPALARQRHGEGVPGRGFRVGHARGSDDLVA